MINLERLLREPLKNDIPIKDSINLLYRREPQINFYPIENLGINLQRINIEDFTNVSPIRRKATAVLKAAEKVFWVVSGIFDPVTGFVTQGLADLLCLETLRHGTSWRNVVLIRMYGADPKRASERGACLGLKVGANGSKSEEKIRKARIFFENSKGRFFVQRDSSVGTNFKGERVDIFRTSDYKGVRNIRMGIITNQPLSLYQRCLQVLFVRNVPRFYAWHAGLAEGASPSATGKLARIKRIASGCLNILAPPVNVRFLPEDVRRQFRDDELCMGSALYSEEAIGTDHLGLKGTFLQGIKGNIRERIRQNPGKALLGLVRLINPIGIMVLISFGCYYVFHLVSKDPTPIDPSRVQVIKNGL